MYSLPFEYSSKQVEVSLKCQVSYLPIEARIDRIGFEFLLVKTLPQHLVIINPSQQKVNHMRDFIRSNNLKTKIDTVVNQSILIEADTSMKQVFLDSNLQKHLAMHRVLNFEVCRVRAKLTLQEDQVFDELQLVDQNHSRSHHSNGNYLFILPKQYRLQELQHYLQV